MSQQQERKEQPSRARPTPAEQASGRHSGEGAASAMEQLISQDRQREQEGLVRPEREH